MPDVTEHTRTIFEAVGLGNYTQAMTQAGRAAYGAGKFLNSLTGIVSPLNQVLGGLATGGAVVAAAALGNMAGEFENVRARLAGTVSALGFVDDFEAGLGSSEKIMQRIYADAAALPGEAEDYVEIFVNALPVLEGAVGGTLSAMTEFSNTYGAVAASMTVNAVQASMDLTKMLAAGKGMASQEQAMFRNLLPYMNKVEGYADLTSQSFNELDQSARGALLEKTLAKMSPMVEEMSNSWDAVTGSMATAVRTTFRLSGMDLFDSMKTAMTGVSDLLVDSTGELTVFGQQLAHAGNTIGSAIGGGLVRMVDMLGKVAGKWDEIIARINIASNAASANAAGLGTLGAMGVAGMGGGASSLGGVAGIGVAAAAIAAGVDVVMGSWETFSSIFDSMESIFGGALNETFEMLVVAGGALAALLEPFVAGLMVVGIPLLQVLGTTITLLMTGLKGFFVLVEVGAAIIWDKLKPSFDEVFSLLAEFGNWLDKISSTAVEAVNKTYLAQQAAEKAAEFATQRAITDAMGSSSLAYAKSGYDLSGLADIGKTTDRTSPKSGGKAKVVQDFRNSRFTIEQKFEEGFDPDRIAVAFSSDLGRVGEQRLQSGFEPMFSTR